MAPDCEINRRTFLKGAAAATVAAALPYQALGEANKPNIVFFMMDGLSAKWLWGPTKRAFSTPNFDRLRARSVSFTSCCVSDPICCPSRASMATGVSARNHGLLQNGYDLDPEIPTFMTQLQKGGWRTGAFGKVHFRSQFESVHPDYRPYGFDVVFDTEDPRAGFWLDWVEKEHPEYYEKALATVNEFKIPEISHYGPNKVDLRARIEKIRKNFQWQTPEFPMNRPARYTLPFPREISQSGWITSNAIDYLTKSDPAKPIYAHISYVSVHQPSCPPGECMKNVDESMLPPPAPVEWVNDPYHPKCFPETEGVHRVIPKDWRTVRHYYLADVTSMDQELGKIMAALEKSGRLDNTYFIVVSDHGELLMDHGFMGKNERHYDSCVRVPLMISGPGLRRGINCDQLVQLEDIFPTVMEMAGLPMPRPKMIPGPQLSMDKIAAAEQYPGRSLMGICRGEKPADWRDAVEIESYNNINSTTPEFWARTIRTNDWRYTMYPDNSGEQLFSLKNDPDEQHNLVGDAAYAKVRTDMRDRLLNAVILQDYPHTRRDCFSLGVY